MISQIILAKYSRGLSYHHMVFHCAAGTQQRPQARPARQPLQGAAPLIALTASEQRGHNPLICCVNSPFMRCPTRTRVGKYCKAAFYLGALLPMAASSLSTVLRGGQKMMAHGPRVFAWIGGQLQPLARVTTASYVPSMKRLTYCHAPARGVRRTSARRCLTTMNKGPQGECIHWVVIQLDCPHSL